MNNDERRRYFRINETIGLSIHEVGSTAGASKQHFAPNTVELITGHDEAISSLLDDIASENPKVAQLLSLFNQKIERITGLVATESEIFDRIANKVQEVNISACGLAFGHDEEIENGRRLKLELTLYPDEIKLLTDGVVVGCDPVSDDISDGFYCRVDFLGMSTNAQEKLIQHVVKRQGVQLKSRQNENT